MSINWKKKLTSRKFWIAICSFISMLVVAFGVSQNEATTITSIIMAGATVISYILAEGWTDEINIKSK